MTHEDGFQQRIAVVGEPFNDVSPGQLPRTLDELRTGLRSDAAEDGGGDDGCAGLSDLLCAAGGYGRAALWAFGDVRVVCGSDGAGYDGGSDEAEGEGELSGL